jgi:hypothetical protein
MVFSLTAAIYGEPDVTPITEDVPAVPINPYGQSKLAVDYMLAGTCRANGLAAASLRYFNVGGALGRHGERHEPETYLISNLLAVPAGRLPSVERYGTDYPTAPRSGTTCTSSTWARRTSQRCRRCSLASTTSSTSALVPGTPCRSCWTPAERSLGTRYPPSNGTAAPGTRRRWWPQTSAPVSFSAGRRG